MPFLASSSKRSREHWVSFAIALLGIGLMFASKQGDNYIKARFPGSAEAIEYTIEHLGAVLVVAMLVRVVLEEGYQRAFLGSLTEEVQKQVRESIDRTSRESLKPLTDELVKAKDSIAALDIDLTNSIEQLASALTYKIIQKIPPDLRKVLEDKVLNSTFVRPEYKVRLVLRPYPLADGSSSPDVLEVVVETSYTVRNQSREKASFPCVSWLDDLVRPSGKRECQFTHFTYGHVDSEGRTHFIPAADMDDLENAGKITQSKGMVRLRYDIDEIDPEAVYEVVVRGKQLMRVHDVFVWNVAILTNRLELTMDLEGGITLQNLEVIPKALHHADMDARTVFERDTHVSMKLDQVFLPYQGIEVRWSPKSKL